MSQLEALFKTLGAEIAATEAKTAPLRAKRDALQSKLAPIEAEMRDLHRQFAAIEMEEKLFDKKNDLAKIARALGAKKMSDSTA